MSQRRAGLAVAGAALACAGIVLAIVAGSGWLERDAAEGPSEAPAAGVVIAPDLVPWQDVTWERIDPPAMTGPLTQTPVAIVRAGDGFVVLGNASDGIPDAETWFGAVWSSRDGRAWDLHRMIDGVPAGDTAELRFAAVGPAGLLVAGGVCCSIEQSAMWLATEGLRFERVASPAERDATIFDLEAGPPGYVAVGATTAGDPNDPDYTGAVWTSPDGRAWTAVDPAAAGLGPGWISDVLWTDAGWVAVGRDDDGKTSDGAVWRSADGLAWERVAIGDPTISGPDEETLDRVLPVAGGLFAQGGSGRQADREQCEGLLLGAGVVGVAGADLALSCGWLVTTHWVSADGGATWERTPPVQQAFDGPPLPPGPGGRRLIDHRVLDAGGPGLVVVDAETPAPEAGDLVGTWVSDDGRSWRPVGAAGKLFGAILQDLVVVGRTIVGVEHRDAGEDRTDIGVWIGTVRP